MSSNTKIYDNLKTIVTSQANYIIHNLINIKL